MSSAERPVAESNSGDHQDYIDADEEEYETPDEVPRLPLVHFAFEPSLTLSAQGLGSESETTSLTSLATEIRKGVVENGRLYATFGREGNTSDHEYDHLLTSSRIWLTAR